jgi:CheY-like chemotaxis protein/HPt (histidine-containing phosphotransfer) domain-containing protein
MINQPAGVQADRPTQALDPMRLADVLRGGSVTAAVFLAEFRRSTDADVEELLAAAQSGQLARVEELAHRIEGASKVIGAAELAAACCALAATVRSGPSAGLRVGLDTLLQRVHALHQCMGEFEAHAALGGAQLRTAERVDPRAICAGLVFLVVEDHEFQCSMIVRLLRHLGAVDVQGFADGATALAALREMDGPAILVLDLAMPTLNGMEVVRIAAQEQLPVSVIINSAIAQDMLQWPVQTARSYGAAVLGAVSKPLTAAKLAPLLAQHRHDMGPGERWSTRRS